MHEAGNKAIRKHQFMHATYRKHRLPVTANVPSKQFNQGAPNLAYAIHVI